MERLTENMKSLKGEEMTSTDAEACAYLYTASLTQPMNSDWSQIYLYIAGKVYEKWRTKESGVTMPEDIRVKSLRDDQMADLNRPEGVDLPAVNQDKAGTGQSRVAAEGRARGGRKKGTAAGIV